jgi:hypothetical protein
MTAPKTLPGFDIGTNEQGISFVSGFDFGNPRPPSKPKPAPETVTLRGISVSLNSDVGGAFVTDCARNRERLFSDSQLQEKYDIAPTDWNDIIKNKPLRLAISRECERRMLNNDAAREAAAKQFTKAPEILGGILEDQRASPRHRIEAAKELRATARTGDEKPGIDSEHFVITINLGADEKIVVDAGPLPPKQTQDAHDAEEW